MSDALGSAKVVLLSIERSLAAWQALAAADHDARIGGLIEVLEALRTGVELRFPDAPAFNRPGLDDGAGEGSKATQARVSARAIGSDDSGDECAGERP
jgi:hypothetical protein